MPQLKTANEAVEILDILKEIYPDPETELNYEDPFQLLIAVILSAQTTDQQVNKVTADLFANFATPEEIAELTPKEVEKYIQGVGLYRNKSKYLVETCRKLIADYDGQVPRQREDLMKLSGVGRKTANVVASCAFDEDAIAVDTHVFRVSNRIGLVSSDRVREVEEGLMELIPQGLWSSAHHWLIFHGRRTCRARKPKCAECPVKDYCNYYQSS